MLRLQHFTQRQEVLQAFRQVQLLVSASDVDNYKQIKADLDKLRNLVEKSELWVFKARDEEPPDQDPDLLLSDKRLVLQGDTLRPVSSAWCLLMEGREGPAPSSSSLAGAGPRKGRRRRARGRPRTGRQLLDHPSGALPARRFSVPGAAQLPVSRRRDFYR